MDDIVERLRDIGCDREPFTPEHAKCQCRVAHKAADEIEKLRELLRRADAVSTWETTAEGRSFQYEIDQALNR